MEHGNSETSSEEKMLHPSIDDNELIDDQTNPQEKSEERTWFNRAFGPISPGSLRGSIFNMAILALGAGCLSLPQKVHYMTLVGSPIIIILSGLANGWTLLLLSAMANKYQMTSYSQLATKLHGKWLSKVLDLTIIFHTFGIIILYQVIIYKLIGGVINELGNYGYESLDSFLTDSFWKSFYYKFPVNYGLALCLIIPLCLLKDISKMRFSSVLGIFSLFFLVGIIIIQSPWYIIDFFKNSYDPTDPKKQYNYYDFSVGFNKDMSFFKSVATLFYAYSCHVGAFPVLRVLENNSRRRSDKVFIRALILDIVCYLTVGIVGYLSMPINTPDLIIERKSIFASDWIMTIGRISFIFTLLMKIPANFNAFRLSTLELQEKDSNNISNCYNYSLTIPTIAMTTLIASLYQSITDYMSLLGSFCAVIISFIVPGLLFVKGNEYHLTHWKNIIVMILIGIMTLIGLSSGVFTIMSMIDKASH